MCKLSATIENPSFPHSDLESPVLPFCPYSYGMVGTECPRTMATKSLLKWVAGQTQQQRMLSGKQSHKARSLGTKVVAPRTWSKHDLIVVQTVSGESDCFRTTL